MSWVTVIWSMVASACLTLAALHLMVWCKRRAAWAYLFFVVTAAGTAGMAFCELWMMRAETPEQFGTALRWVHVPVFVLIVGMVGFVQTYLGTGRRWLAWSTCTLRAFSLLLNFLMVPNVNYREITRLWQIPFLGDSVTVCAGVPSPWNIIGHLSLLLLVIFVADAGITVWRRGDRRQAVIVGGSLVFFVLAATVQTMLVRWEVFHWPETAVLFFLGIVVAMAYEMSGEVLRAVEVSNELRESELRLSLAADAAGFGVWAWDTASNVVWGSERWHRLFGFAPEEAVSLDSVLQRVHPDDRPAVEHEVRHAMETQSTYSREYRIRLPDGTERWVAASGRMFLDEPAMSARMLGATINITERKHAELELQQQRNELAHLARVTTLGELSSSLAHELNQPLAIILTNAQAAQRLLAQDSPDIVEVQDVLADIVSEDQRAGEVIRRLRALLKPGDTHVRPLSVNDVIEDVLRIMRTDLVGRSITVHTSLVGHLPQVAGDHIQLQQVLLNLILNAGEAMTGNSPSNRHLTFVTTHRDGTVQISVSDNGCGLPPDVGGVFAPFYTTKKDGLGMGLPICRSIMAAHKGRLWAERGASGGATFHLELPVEGVEG